MDLVEIDGSVLEGGGQILRLSVTLSALCGIGIHIINIRAGRSKPGLAAQHLKGIQLVRDMCHGDLKGDTIGSTEIKFIPGSISGKEFEADTKTAGSTSLLLQVALPCALFAKDPITLHLRGGTNADMAPQVDFTTEVFRPNLEKFGATFDFELHKRGYFPKGGGRVTVQINPIKSLKAINMTSIGGVKDIHGWSYTAGSIPIAVAHQMADGATRTLRENIKNINPNIECYMESKDMAAYNANGIILVCETLSGCIIGGTGLGKRNITPYNVGISAAKEIINTINSGSCVDSYTQDQLIIFMALAEGTSYIRVGELTLHTKTAMYIIEKLIKVKFDIKEEQNTNIISCVGIGLVNKRDLVKEDL